MWTVNFQMFKVILEKAEEPEPNCQHPLDHQISKRVPEKHLFLLYWLCQGNGTPLQYSCLENPWTEEPGRLQSMGSLRVGNDWATSLSLFTFMHWRRKWQPTPVFLPGESQGRGKPGGLPSLGSHRVGHNWRDLAAAAAKPLTVWITTNCRK